MQMQTSFGSMEMAGRIRQDSALMKAHALINWEALRPLLTGLYKRELTRAGGQDPIDALLMFKATLLGQWHNLSDPKLEEALTVRIDFMHFCGLTLSDASPDESTLCRFRNRLIQAGKLEALLTAVNQQLQAHGLMVRTAVGAVIDATLIESAARPNRQITIEYDERGEAKRNEDGNIPDAHSPQSANDAVANTPSETTLTRTETSSVDEDASWVKKGSKSHYGYRSYATTDGVDGYIQGMHTAPANESETKHLESALSAAQDNGLKPDRVYADKGYASAANRAYLRKQGIKSAIMHSAKRNTPLTPRQHQSNKLISKVRYIVEQAFGTLKRKFGMHRASYMGTLKVNAQMTLKAMCFNLLKAANKICLLMPKTGELRPT
jgi:transposase, IS5 family